MKTLRILACVCGLLGAAASWAPGATPALTLHPGWNLVGMPCTLSAAAFRSGFPGNDLQIFRWRDGAYAAPNELTRGDSYFVYAQAQESRSDLCSEQAVNAEFGEHTPEPGWNMLGNPYLDNLPLQDAVRILAAGTLNQFFTFENGRFRSLDSTATADAWGGFFVYYEPAATPALPQAACGSDSDCDDADATTDDQCLNPGTALAQCVHLSTSGQAPACDIRGECFSDNDCSADEYCAFPGHPAAVCAKIGGPLLAYPSPNICLCPDEADEDSETCPDVWVRFSPVQMFNPWGYPSDTRNSTLDENSRIRTYFSGFDIELKEILRASCPGEVCFDGCCERGDDMAFRVTNADAMKIILNGLLEGGDDPGENPSSQRRVCRVLNLSVYSAATGRPPSCRGAVPDPVCARDADCSDADASTHDTCVNGGALNSDCLHEPMPWVCITDTDCGAGQYCNNPGGPNAACVTPADCPVKTMLCNHPEGCDTILWKKPGCTGDACQADPPADDFSYMINLTPGSDLELGYHEVVYEIIAPEVIGGREYYLADYTDTFYNSYPDPIAHEYLRLDDNWQLFYAYEIAPCVFRETLHIPFAAEPGSTWAVHDPLYKEPTFYDVTETQHFACRMISRTRCSIWGMLLTENQPYLMNYNCESSLPDGFDVHTCYLNANANKFQELHYHPNDYVPQ